MLPRIVGVVALALALLSAPAAAAWCAALGRASRCTLRGALAVGHNRTVETRVAQQWHFARVARDALLLSRAGAPVAAVRCGANGSADALRPLGAAAAVAEARALLALLRHEWPDSPGRWQHAESGARNAHVPKKKKKKK